jgi:hypothetical protein
MVYQFPNTRLFWDKKKNKDDILDNLKQSSRHRAYFKCPNCSYEWKSQILLWNKRRYCPCCGFDGNQNSIELNRSIIEQNPITTFRMANPEDAKMWCHDLNGNMTPDSILYGSNKEAHFECANGHKFTKIIYEMTTNDGKPRGCPYCNEWINKAYPGENDFFTLCLIAKDMWNYDKNKMLNPELLLTNSGEKAHFKCSKGHLFIKTIQQFYENPKCPKCDTIEKEKLLEEKQKLLNKKIKANSFRKYNPDASKLWIDSLNEGLTPDNVAKRSRKTIYMRCENDPEHIFQKKICDIPKKNPFGCPDCREKKKIPIQGVNDIFSISSDLEEMWDWEKNKEINPYHLLKTSETNIHLKCNKGHEFTRSVRNSVRNFNCPVCKQERNSISNYPHMVKQWDFLKNEEIDINIVSSHSKNDAWWKCKGCGYEWQSKISSRRASKGLCPCCENRTVVVEGITDLFTIVPDLKIDYDFKKNIGINKALLSTSYNEPIHWKCNTCGYEWLASPVGRIKKENGNYIARSCPSCVGLVRTKTYAEEYQELNDRFIENKNKCRLSDLKNKDKRLNFWWHCYICGEDFESTLSSMIRSKDSKNKGCPYCAGKKVKRENSFAYLHPELMDEYDPENRIDPYEVTEYSGKYVKWICRNNPEHKWKARFYSRARGEGGCNICRNWNYGKMFSEEHPEFETYYDTEKNERPFNTYSNMSNENAWWKCKKGHSFEQSIKNYSRQGRFECPVCTNKILVKGENDLESQYPDLASEFDIEKNGTTPDMILSSHTNAEIWWKCNEGHEFQRSVWYRVNQVNDCPVCNRSFIIKGVNDFQTAYPDVVKIWDYQKNGRGPDTISDIDTRKYSFKCTLGHQYETQLSTAINHNFECLVCTNEIVKEGINSLLDTHEELAKEFSPKEERKPYEFNKNYSYSIKWKCPTCNGEYRYPINKREFGDDSCPYCNKGRALLGYNSLLDTDFELSKEWSPSNERGPETYIKSTSTWVYWICPTCNGEYTRPINERELSDDSCPYCKGTKLLHGYNSFKVKHEDLMEEWDYTNNYLLCNSEYILDTYSYKVWWICKDCNYKYFMSPRLRIFYQHRNMISCPHCKGLRQKKIHFF